MRLEGGMPMAEFALTAVPRPGVEDLLMLVDDRREAEEIAAELGRRGCPVRVIEVRAPRRNL
jgi:hypothetical protein